MSQTKGKCIIYVKYCRDALQEQDNDQPAQIFPESTDEIHIERSWLDLRKDLEHDIRLPWEGGNRIYREGDPIHR